MTGGNELTVLTEERTVVDAESHAHRRLVDSNRFERFGVLCVADRVTDLKAVNTDHGTDITVLDHIGLHVTHTRERMQLFDLRLDHRAVFLSQRNSLSVFELTAVYTTDTDSSDVAVVVQRSDEHLRCTRVVNRSRDILDDSVHEVGQVRRRFSPVPRHPALFSRAVQRLEIQLVIGSVEVTHEVEHLFLYLVRPAVQFVHFIDHHDRFESEFQCFLQHKTGLRHRALERIDEQQYAVRHVQHTLYFATEVRVPRSVNNIDFSAFVVDGYVLGKNSDTTLTLEVVVVQDQLLWLIAEL